MKDLCVISVSGTPGTGKSTIARCLSEELEYELIDLNEEINKRDLYDQAPNGVHLVDSDALEEVVRSIPTEGSGKVIDGHLSHLLPPTFVTDVVVLRTRPEVLNERLKERGYSKKKIKENLEAEALGIIISEAVESHDIENIYEIETTDISPSETVRILLKAFKDDESLRPGSIDWLEDYFLNKA